MENENEIYTDENGVNLGDAILLVGSSYGQYVPMHFVNCHKDTYLKDILSNYEKDAMMYGPNGEDYWELWERIMATCKPVINGKTYSLYESNGDLWGIPLNLDAV